MLLQVTCQLSILSAWINRTAWLADGKEPTNPLSPGLLGETCSLYSFHLCPSRRNIGLRETRVVDEVQIHVFDAKLYGTIPIISSGGEGEEVSAHTIFRLL